MSAQVAAFIHPFFGNAGRHWRTRQCSKPRGGRVAVHGFHLAFLMDDECRSKQTTAYTPPPGATGCYCRTCRPRIGVKCPQTAP